MKKGKSFKIGIQLFFEKMLKDPRHKMFEYVKKGFGIKPPTVEKIHFNPKNQNKIMDKGPNIISFYISFLL